MPDFDLVITSKYDDALNMLIPHYGRSRTYAILARCLNVALFSARNKAAKLIKERYNIPVHYIGEHFKIMQATNRRQRATLMVRSHRLPITQFKTNPSTPPSQKGIPVSARKRVSTEIVRGRTKVWSHAFLAKVAGPHGGEHLGLFERKGKERLPIKEYRSLSIPEMVGYAPIIDGIMETAKERLDKELEHQIQFMLAGGN